MAWFKKNKDEEEKIEIKQPKKGPALDINLAVQQERDFLAQTLQETGLADNPEAKQIVDILQMQTEFLISSQRVPIQKKS